MDAVPATVALVQPSTTQVFLPSPKVSKRRSKIGDQGQKVEVAKGKRASQGDSRLEDKGKGKEAKPLPETKGPKAAPKVKDATPKAKDAAPKATDPLVSQLGSKEDPPLAKA